MGQDGQEFRHIPVIPHRAPHVKSVCHPAGVFVRVQAEFRPPKFALQTEQTEEVWLVVVFRLCCLRCCWAPYP